MKTLLNIISIPTIVVCILIGAPIWLTAIFATVPIATIINKEEKTMGIINRFTDIMQANINDRLDRMEEPSKMIDQYLRELDNNLAEVREKTAEVKAQESRASKMYLANEMEIKRYEDAAKMAIRYNDDDARILIAKKKKLEAKGFQLKNTYDIAHNNAKKMEQMHDKLVSDIEELCSRRDTIKAKVAVAKTTQCVNKISSCSDKTGHALSAFDRMEKKADSMLDQAIAMEELIDRPTDRAAKIMNHWDSLDAWNALSVEDELAKYKEEYSVSKECPSN